MKVVISLIDEHGDVDILVSGVVERYEFSFPLHDTTRFGDPKPSAIEAPGPIRFECTLFEQQ